MKMNNEELNTALYQKMEREQDKYRKWLVQCPPEEILSHAYEYVVREDILMSMEELNLPDDQAMALLKQRGPLDDVFKDFSKLETDYMETVRGAIESFAERKAAKDRNWEARKGRLYQKKKSPMPERWICCHTSERMNRASWCAFRVKRTVPERMIR